MSNVAGSLAILVSADTASAESSLSKVAAIAERESKRIERAQEAAKKEGERFVSMVQKQVDTFGMSSTAMLRYEANLKGVANQVNPLVDELERLKKSQANISGAALNDAAKGAEHARGATAGFTRELLVLSHELSQGNYKRFGGSLLVLAEYSGTATKALSALLGPLGLVAGAGGLMALAIYKGYEESEALRKSLVLTGNYAGITEGHFNSLSHELSASTGISIGKTRDALQALANTGEIGPRVFAPLAKAVTLYAKATGETEEAVVKDFARMNDGVAKFAAEHNKQLNFISAAQYEYIKRLEEQGKKEEAELVVAKAISDHLANVMKPNLGYIEQALKSSAAGWDSFWDSAKGLGRVETVEDQIDALKKKLADLPSTGSALPGPQSLFSLGWIFGQDDERQLTFAKLIGAEKKQAEQDSAAAAKAEADRVQKAGIAASDYLRKLSDEVKGVDRLKRDLEELHTQAEARRKAAGGGAAGEAAFPHAEEDRLARGLRLRDRSKEDRAAEAEAKKVADLVRKTSEEYAKETAVLKDQAEQYDRYNKVMDKSAVVKLEEMLRTEEGRKIKAKDVEMLRQQAAAEDAQAEAMKKSEEAAKQRIKVEEQRVAAEKSLKDFTEKQNIGAAAEIDRIREATKELGLNTLELKQHNAERAIQKALDDELSKSRMAGVDTAPAKVAAEQDIAAIQKALAEEDAKQKEFGFGASKVFKQYQDDAANAAKFAEQFIGGALKRSEDALFNFVKTGKLSFSNLFSFMAEEFIRQQIRMAEASVIEGIRGGGFSSFSDIVDGIGLLFGGTSIASLDTGTNYVPYDGMPAVLHKGEAVVPAAYNPAAGGTTTGTSGGDVHITFPGTVYNIGDGVSRGDVVSAVKAGNAQLEARIRRLMRDGQLG